MKPDHNENGQWRLTVRLPSIPHLAPSNLLLALKTSTLIAAVIALYFQDLRIIFTDALSDESSSYILIVPVLLAYLVYRKRKMIRAAIGTERSGSIERTRDFEVLAGILLCAASTALYWYGSYTFAPLEYHALTLPFFAAGLTLVLFNPQTLRQAAFPIVFLCFLAPPPAEIVYSFGSTLSIVSSEASNTIVNALGIHSTIFSLAGTPAISITQANGTVLAPFAVDIGCSGIYSLIGFLVFTAFISFVVRDKLWKKAAIFIVGFPLIYFLNILRITSILLIGYQWGEDLALSIFHLLGGWILIFIGTLVLLTASEKLFKTEIFTGKQALNSCSNCKPASDQLGNFCHRCGRLLRYPESKFKKTDFAEIGGIVTVVILLLSIQTPVFALTQGPAQVLAETPAGQQANTGALQIFPETPNYTLQYVQRDTEFEKVSGQDYSLVYSYTPQDLEKETVFVGLEIAQTTTPLHRWEVCLVTFPQSLGYQPLVDQLDLRDVQILQNPSIVARYFAFEDKSDNQTQVVLYWYEDAIFTANNTSQQKYVKISLIAYPSTVKDVGRVENELLPFATAIVNYWQPIRTWTAIATALSTNGLFLAEITTALLAAFIILYTYETVRQRRVNARTYQKLSSQNKQVIDTIAETRKKGKPTLDAIAEAYRIKTGLQIENEDLLRRISETEKTGIAESSVANVQDEPTRIWKVTMTRRHYEHLEKWKHLIASRLNLKRGF